MKIVKLKAPFIETQYGFEWGAAKVERVASLDDGSVILFVATSKEQLEIRVTRSGLIRIQPIKKIKNESN